MAGELQLALGRTGRTLYAVVRSATAAVWNGSAFEAYAGANWATYAVPLTEQGGSGYYAGTFPAAVPAGLYFVEVRDQAGGSPNADPLVDPLAGGGWEDWDGSALVPLSGLPTAAENADALLGRNVAGGSSTGRTVSSALYALRNKVAISSGTLTVYSTDDVTPAWTATVTDSASANPITAVDPG